MNKLFLTALTLGLTSSLSGLSVTTARAEDAPAGQYKVDADHSKVGFSVSHLVVSEVDGRFKEFEGDFTIGKTPSESSFNATVKVDSIDTDQKKRDGHLKSPDFFDAAKFPKLTFKSKTVSGDWDDLKITGDLTIRGKTKEVTLGGKYSGSVKDPWGNDRAVFKANTKISRKAFGLTWNDLMEKGPVVGDEVTIAVAVEGIKKK